VLAGIMLAGIALAVLIGVWVSRCPSEVDITIGEFDSKDAGMRSSIKKLAAEIHRCPEAKIYRIIWSSPSPEKVTPDRRAVLYDRERKRLGYEHDVFSGIAGKPYRR
jgi:hypothetical protein